ncbi:MAG TPA: hypothetical protein VGF95_07085 [Solirubrobacteraceae bacterium]|jgi:hypothetical protein
MSTAAGKNSTEKLRLQAIRGRMSGKRGLTVAAAALAAISLSACGAADNRTTSGTYAGEDGASAPYLNVGPLVYQVQISRSLNPYETEDSQYLAGMPKAERELKPGEEWFGVFMMVFNEHNATHVDASDITIYDTEGQVYHPIVPNSTNLYAYRPGKVAGKGQIPAPDTTASYGPTGGALLYYKIPLEALEDRPLTIKIVSPTDPAEAATAELDV